MTGPGEEQGTVAPGAGGQRIGEAILGVVAIALALFIAWGTWTAPAIAARSVVGPGVFPALIAAGLFLTGLRLLYEARSAQAALPAVPPFDRVPVAVLAGALLAFALLLERLGWIPCAAALFAVAAYAFGSRGPLRDLLIGLAIAVIVFVLFDTLLGLSLPLGTWVEPGLVAAGLID